MRSLVVVEKQPLVKIYLNFFNFSVDFLAKGHLIKPLGNGLMESFANAVCLWRTSFRFIVFDIVERQKELIIVTHRITAVLCASIRQDPHHWKNLLLQERQDTIIEQIG